jgi:hypothetical protein
MALLHQATIKPTKLELLNAWLPHRPWYRGPSEPALQRVAACRFDDPAGEVGVETMLVQAEAGGAILHMPLTYRGAPLGGGDPFLIGTCEHSVLGTRWVYDGCGDPVYVATVAAAIMAGTGQADEFIDTPDGPRRREPAMTVRGSGWDGIAPTSVRAVIDGDPTVVTTDTGELIVFRAVAGDRTAESGRLTGNWPDGPTVVLATLR